MASRIVEVVYYEVDGVITGAKRDCLSESRCFAEYIVQPNEGMQEVKNIIEGSGDGFWSQHLIKSDVLYKEKYSNTFCVNEECYNISIIFEFTMLLVSLFFLYNEIWNVFFKK